MSNGWNDLRGYYPGDWVRPRQNAGHWRPLVDWTEVFPGHRAVDRTGRVRALRCSHRRPLGDRGGGQIGSA